MTNVQQWAGKPDDLTWDKGRRWNPIITYSEYSVTPEALLASSRFEFFVLEFNRPLDFLASGSARSLLSPSEFLPICFSYILSYQTSFLSSFSSIQFYTTSSTFSISNFSSIPLQLSRVMVSLTERCCSSYFEVITARTGHSVMNYSFAVVLCVSESVKDIFRLHACLQDSSLFPHVLITTWPSTVTPHENKVSMHRMQVPSTVQEQLTRYTSIGESGIDTKS
ncbi:hypothetical protein J6590_079637 [Homalodisca vitripennis]|nr:hypothetical protein J6590_079637 [Homalodisca vitripennis]